MHKSLISFAAASVLSVSLVGQALAGVAAPPTVSVQEAFVAPGIGEYTISIDSPAGSDWYIPWFAVSNDQSFGTDVTNGIGNWTSDFIDATTWDAGYEFYFGAPGGSQLLLTSTDVGTFASLFGTDSVANVYWAGSYLDYSAGATFSLIGPDETRGGFEFGTFALASNYAVLVQGAGSLFLTGSITDVAGPAGLPLLGIGLLYLVVRQRGRHRVG